jgi:hypothetical protein
LFLMPAGSMARIGIIAPFPPIPIEPPYCPDPPPGYTYRWVPPEYRTVYDRVWVEESVQRVLEWVQISPDRWERQVSLKMRADRALERHHRTRRELALTRVNCGSPWDE